MLQTIILDVYKTLAGIRLTRTRLSHLIFTMQIVGVIYIVALPLKKPKFEEENEPVHSNLASILELSLRLCFLITNSSV
jgi:hypothetical protein